MTTNDLSNSDKELLDLTIARIGAVEHKVKFLSTYLDVDDSGNNTYDYVQIVIPQITSSIWFTSFDKNFLINGLPLSKSNYGNGTPLNIFKEFQRRLVRLIEYYKNMVLDIRYSYLEEIKGEIIDYRIEKSETSTSSNSIETISLEEKLVEKTSTESVVETELKKEIDFSLEVEIPTVEKSSSSSNQSIATTTSIENKSKKSSYYKPNSLDLIEIGKFEHYIRQCNKSLDYVKMHGGRLECSKPSKFFPNYKILRDTYLESTCWLTGYEDGSLLESFKKLVKRKALYHKGMGNSKSSEVAIETMKICFNDIEISDFLYGKSSVSRKELSNNNDSTLETTNLSMVSSRKLVESAKIGGAITSTRVDSTINKDKSSTEPMKISTKEDETGFVEVKLEHSKIEALPAIEEKNDYAYRVYKRGIGIAKNLICSENIEVVRNECKISIEEHKERLGSLADDYLKMCSEFAQTTDILEVMRKYPIEEIGKKSVYSIEELVIKSVFDTM